MRLISLFLAALLAAAPLARAGIPVTNEKVCPVDGKTFTTTGTASCSYFGATMTLRRITSCDFVTVLPVCPGSEFPVYREFDDVAVARLKALVETAEYKALATRSRFFRAWTIETWLAGQGSGALNASEKFGLLITGLSREPKPGIDDTEYRALMLREADAAIPRFSEEDQPFILALVAFLELRHGSRDAAAARLKTLHGVAEGIPYLKRYISAITACLNDPSAPTCDPRAEIPR